MESIEMSAQPTNDVQISPEIELCTGCSLDDSAPRYPENKVYVTEMFEDATEQSQSHAFFLEEEAIKKHAFLYKESAARRPPKLRVMVFENLKSTEAALEFGVSREILDIHLWTNQLPEYREYSSDDKSFSSLWWRSRRGILLHPLQYVKWTNEDERAQKSNCWSVQLTVPITKWYTPPWMWPDTENTMLSPFFPHGLLPNQRRYDLSDTFEHILLSDRQLSGERSTPTGKMISSARKYFI